jgi:hypothetical protein
MSSLRQAWAKNSAGSYCDCARAMRNRVTAASINSSSQIESTLSLWSRQTNVLPQQEGQRSGVTSEAHRHSRQTILEFKGTPEALSDAAPFIPNRYESPSTNLGKENMNCGIVKKLPIRDKQL